MAPLVSVCVTTYNQQPYIRQAMDSFLTQETTFGFEILVHDDASNDGTTEILRQYEIEYPNIVSIYYENENQWGRDTYKGGYNRGLLVPHARGKYIAICEGDDYWINTHKLQRQVDYLEGHPETALCCHAAKVLDGHTGQTLGSMGMGSQEHDVSVQELICGWNIPTASWVYRKGILDGLDDEWPFDKPAGDFPSVLYASRNGLIHYDPMVMSAYRYQTPGSWTFALKDSNRALQNARRWINMYDNLDKSTGGVWHQEFVLAATSYVNSIVSAYSTDKEADLSQFAAEVRRRFSFADRVKVLVKRALHFAGLEIVQVGYGKSKSHRLIKVEPTNE